MKPRERKHARPSFEGLERRDCPAVTANVSGGNLLIRSTTSSDLAVVQTADQQFQVTNNGSLVAVLPGVTQGVFIRLGSGGDRVVVDLQGRTVAGNVQINDSGGRGDYTVTNGTVNGGVVIAGGSGAARATLGVAGQNLTVRGASSLRAGNSGGNALGVGPQANLQGPVSIRNFQQVGFTQGSVLGGGVAVAAGSKSMRVNVDGKITQTLSIQGSPAADTLVVGASASVNDLVANLGNGNNVVASAGAIGQRLLVTAGSGNDNVAIGGTNGGRLSLSLGNGTNSALLAQNVGAGGASGDRVLVVSGGGVDTVTVTPDFAINGTGTIQLGGGNDTFVLQDRARVVSLLVNGGFGFNVFQGAPAQLNVVPQNFQKFQ